MSSEKKSQDSITHFRTSSTSLNISTTMFNSSESTVFASLTSNFDPWALPEDLTLFSYAPEDVRDMLHPHWHKFKAIHPVWYYVMGLIYVLVGVVSVVGNYVVLYIFVKFKELRRPSNVLIINLAFFDFFLMVALMPECIYNFLTGGPWRFGELGCQLHSFIGGFCGYTQIWTLTAISYDRFNVIVWGLNGRPLTYCKAVTIITCIWIWAAAWSVAPLVGWGHYAMDGMLASCSFDMIINDFSNKSHILASAVTNYMVPVSMIAACYWCIVKAVFHHEKELRDQAKKMNVSSLRSNAGQQQVSAEIRIAKVAITNVCLWLFSWTPFMVICMMGMFGNQEYITPLVSNLPVILSKTACVYNPIVYAISHPKYKECLSQLFPRLCAGNIKPKNTETLSVNSGQTEMATRA